MKNSVHRGFKYIDNSNINMFYRNCKYIDDMKQERVLRPNLKYSVLNISLSYDA